MLGARGCAVEEDCVAPRNVEGTCCWEAAPSPGHSPLPHPTTAGCNNVTAGTCRWMQRTCETLNSPFCRYEWTPYHQCGVAGWETWLRPDNVWEMCPQEQGWCRLSGQPPARATRELCNDVGGEYHDPYPHQPDYAPTLPCCVFTHTGMPCFNWSAAECEAEGGVASGTIGTTCDSVTCVTPANSWGACCSGEGFCTDHVRADDCHAEPGSLWYACELCEDTPCEKGACCLPEASCVDDRTAPACALVDGYWQGPATTCDDPGMDCEYRITHPCCLLGGGCTDISRRDCEGFEGMVMEHFQRCSDLSGGCPSGIGACCEWWGALNADCHMDLIHPCEPLGGKFMGQGTRCSEARCYEGYGLCCTTSGLCLGPPAWLTMTRQFCEAREPPGFFIPSLGNLECSLVSCVGEIGACCVHHNRCDRRPEHACGPEQGIWQGAGTHCDMVFCPETIGACCSTAGHCFLTWQDQCEQVAGTFRGEGSECDDVDCGPISSCCLPDGSCVAVGLMDCMARGGAWNSRPPGWPLWNCSSTSCDSGEGACCISQRCWDGVTHHECVVEQGGKFFGDGTVCGQGARKDCTPGACCLPNGNCEYWTQAWCENRGGEWRGLYGDFFPNCRSATGRPFDIDCSEPA